MGTEYYQQQHDQQMARTGHPCSVGLWTQSPRCWPGWQRQRSSRPRERPSRRRPGCAAWGGWP
eukprot:scaffold512387_cov50-Prasinocladus_malaysianus.AAC.1